MQNDEILHLFSGGRDSLLAAGILAEQGYNVKMVTYDNGHMRGVENVLSTARELQCRYGDKICHIGIHSTAMTMQERAGKLWSMPVGQIGTEYPHVDMCQIHCLICKMSMYIHSIAYCKAKGIGFMSDGARKCQGFFVDTEEMRELIMELCRSNGIRMIMPLYDLETDYGRKIMLDDRRLPTKVLEPQCFLGIPMKEPLEKECIDEYAMFYRQIIMPYSHDIIETLIPIKRSEL